MVCSGIEPRPQMVGVDETTELWRPHKGMLVNAEVFYLERLRDGYKNSYEIANFCHNTVNGAL